MTTSGPWTTPHSPGPWISHDTEEGEWVVDLGPRDLARVDLDATVTRLFFGDMETNTGTDIANANLVAAAPDLLAALRGLLETAEHVRHFGLTRAEVWRTLSPRCAEAEAAIAKATGEADR